MKTFSYNVLLNKGLKFTFITKYLVNKEFFLLFCFLGFEFSTGHVRSVVIDLKKKLRKETPLKESDLS